MYMKPENIFAQIQELRQHNVIDKDCRDKYQYIFHNINSNYELQIMLS